MGGRLCVLLLVACVGAGGLASIARADGDPGSDVLVSQNLYIPADAGLTVKQQVQLDNLLQAASGAGFPVRVAIIAGRDDLGAVTELWRRPQAYAQFLGIELSLAYEQRLIVVMPNGFGFNWPGHPAGAASRSLAKIPVGAGNVGLFTATQAAVRRLAAAAGVRLASPGRGAGGGGFVGGSGSPGAAATTGGGTSRAGRVTSPAGGGTSPADGVTSPAGGVTSAPASGEHADLIAAAAVVGLLGVGLAARLGLRWRRRLRVGWVMPGFGLLCVAVIGAPIVAFSARGSSDLSQSAALQSNPYLDPGTPLSRAAPGVTLSDQFGRTVSLRSFRGKVVILAFNDSECTTICPLTTAAMLDAKAMLGTAGSRVQLLGIDANPKATSVEDVLSYSQVHGMLHRWHFLTGSLPALKRVWHAYGIASEIQRGEIAHTPALFVIDPQGRLRKLYMTQQSYAAIGQLGQVLAREAASLLAGHPQVRSDLSYAQIPGISPTARVSLPRVGGGTALLGPGGGSHLLLFFASWDQAVTSIAGHLDALNRYATASGVKLPALTAVDEGAVEPSSTTLGRFLHTLPQPLAYPVAIDRSGRVADGYEVQGEPWFVLTSSTGQILWYWQVSTSGWLSNSALARHVRAALAKVPAVPASAAAMQTELAGSPSRLTALHQQASQVLGFEPSLEARIRALRGYPIVINAWASWCAPCRSELGLFASASTRYGRRVAFLGADTGDSVGDARSFLAEHPVSYPSYQMSSPQLQALIPGGAQGLPTTIFLNRAGRLVFVHTGQYLSQGTLDADVTAYARSG